MRYVFSFLVAFRCASGHAVLPQQVRGVDELRLLVEKDGRVQTTLVPFSPPRDLHSFSTVSRLMAWNPEHKASVFSGVRLLTLVKKAGLDPAKVKTITIVGTDGYASQILGEDLKWNPMIAYERDGKKIAWATGGPQAVWPTALPLPEIFLGQGEMWTYYVCTLILNTLPARLEIEAPKGPSTWTFDGRTTETRTGRLDYPPGMRRIPSKKGPAQIAFQNLAAFLNARGLTSRYALSVKTYLGYEYPLEAAPETYEFVYQTDGETIPPWLGGPIQLCRKDRQMSCVYYVQTLQVKAR